MSNKPPSINSELEDRDPNNLSEHIQISWEDVIGEPEKVRSPECAWRVSNYCFNISKNLCYILLSVFIAPITALCLGCTFACLTFEHIWCVTPCLRIWRIECSTCKNYMQACSEAVITPITEAMGSCFSRIHIRNFDESKDKLMSV